MTGKRLHDFHSGERMERFRLVVWIGPATFFILSLAEWKAVGMGGVFLLLLLANVVVIAGLVLVIDRGLSVGAARWVGMVSGAGNIAPAASFSFQESLMMQGRYLEAEASFQDHLSQHPHDHDAQLALASICARYLNKPEMAEQLYHSVIRGAPTPRQESAARNSLIDLYAATGQRGKQMAELAKFAARYPDARAGQEARRALVRMKADMKEG
jgi:hypothetical protein